ncbi:hypothetical protein [Xanthocytophaga agilis]|uniref:Uncharacterized protein n=1 Tax=Xanthocytophaga agilis TaxID=3048010 RepID=A0AAE3R621_9BACT|nr:hypothetical protein [Xanthocytophaga agilis]MDJ1502089.1 hypothetical protein [Xanthocytophaga agilis]
MKKVLNKPGLSMQYRMACAVMIVGGLMLLAYSISHQFIPIQMIYNQFDMLRGIGATVGLGLFLMGLFSIIKDKQRYK